MAKLFIGLIVVGGIILAFVYFNGGVSNFDPTKEGREKRAAIQPGMTWKKVVEITSPGPKTYQTFVPPAREDGAPKPGVRVKWDRESMENEIKTGLHKYGFLMNFKYSEQVAFDVLFDVKGIVIGIQDAATMADLLDTRKK